MPALVTAMAGRCEAADVVLNWREGRFGRVVEGMVSAAIEAMKRKCDLRKDGWRP